ncbi:MAG: SusC/RagA family TonB-linked outer membrane protein [Paludibacteraceae bacterium]|nr:SusC/RagA family TonB-linked outer membrane protein [Paludibacteraceae bacterium]
MMKHKHLSLVLMAVALAFTSLAHAQIKGTVFEESTGYPVIGASILQVGTTNGVITDFDGNFELNVPEGTEIQISYMGFAPQTLPAKDGMVVNLKEDAIQIQEVVAVGYGSQKKKEVTGSVASIKAEDFNAGVQSSPVGLLQGKVAGLNISRTTSDPTSTGYNIQIRGFSTLGQGTGSSPLYIVDGVPTDNIDNISPDEIAAMDVLKDGSAAAIYGTRGTNGVILITTKRGATQGGDKVETQVEYSGYVNVAWINSSLGMANAEEFRNLSNYTGGKLTSMDHGANTDWTAALSRKAAITHNHNLAVSGAHKNFSYRASVNFKDAQGIAKNNGRRDISAKLAADQKALNGWLKLQYDVAYMHYRNDYSDGAFYTQAALLNPTYPIYNETSPNGYEIITNSGQYNPVEYLNMKEAYQEGNYFRGSLKATVDIKVVEGLKVNAFAAFEEGDNNSYGYTSPKLLSPNAASAGDWAYRNGDNAFKQLYEGTIDYVGSWGKHSLVAVAGFSYQRFLYDGQNISNRGFVMESTKYYSIGEGQADKDNLTVSSYRNSYALAAAFARVNYNYADKYLLSASLRAEGSSRFGANNKWGYFPAVSAGWRIKGEQFMSSADWCNELKLRAGFGVTGNNVGSSLRSVALLSKSDVITFAGKDINTYTVTQNVNPDLKWERKFEYNLGLDFGFLDNRLTGSLEGYVRNTKDLLWYYEVPTPPYQYTTLLANAGEMLSYGVELALTGVPVKRGNWTWTSGLTLAWNKNHITKLSDPSKGFNYSTSPQGSLYGNKFNGSDSYTQILEEGGIVGQFYGYKFMGINSEGQWVYEDQYGDPTTNPQTSDKKYLGSAQPAVTYGWNNTVKWKDLDITIFFRGVLGNKVLNATRFMYTPDGTDPSTDYNFFVKDVASHNGAGGGAVYADYQHFSDYWLEDGSYLKCDNITVGYTFRFPESKYVRSLRLYATGQNLFTITSYSGLDPEINTSCIDYPGIDINNYYPKTGSFLFGVNLNLL